MTKKLLKRVAVFGLVVIVVLLAARILPSKPPAPPPLPNPNGYDDFVKASRMLPTFDYSLAATMNLEALREEVASNGPALTLARAGLQRECRVPLQDYATFKNEQPPKLGAANTHGADLAAIKRLAQAFFVEGKLAEREKRNADALSAYLDAIRLGQQTARGGLVITKLVGIACEAIGCNGVQSLAPRLTVAECRAGLQQMAVLDPESEPVQEVVSRERLWSRRTYGLRGYAAEVVALLRQKRFAEVVAFLRHKEKWQEQLQSKVARVQLTRRQLLVELAARAYELENGQPPKSVADLVPAYLKAIPRDPVTGTNLVYTP